jgi:hypothetical protein
LVFVFKLSLSKVSNVCNTIALVVLVAACAFNMIATVRRVPPPPRAPVAVPSNVVMQYEQRLAGVRASLQKRQVSGTVGYLADLPATEMAGNHHAMEAYFLTQFVLVPLIVDAKAEGSKWIVANLHATTIAERLPPGFRVVEEFGSGVTLLEKRAP